MRLELTHQELSYLVKILEEKLVSDENIDDNQFMNMLHQLYSKLIIRENEKLTHKEF
jgi:hypothetical protein